MGDVRACGRIAILNRMVSLIKVSAFVERLGRSSPETPGCVSGVFREQQGA